MLHISRTPVRTALMRLADEGFVVISPGRDHNKTLICQAHKCSTDRGPANMQHFTQMPLNQQGRRLDFILNNRAF